MMKKSNKKKKEPSQSKRAILKKRRTIRCKNICRAVAMVHDSKSQKITLWWLCIFWLSIVNVDVFSYQTITRCSHLYNNAVSAFSCDERVGARGRLQIFSSLAYLQLLCTSTSDRWPYHMTRVLVLGGKHVIARPLIPQNLCQIIF